MNLQNCDLFKLRCLYVEAMQLYHTHGNSPLSDEEFDELKRAIRKLSPNDEILKLVGAPAPADSHLTKVKIPAEVVMGSVANSDTYGNDYADGFAKWYEKISPKCGLVGALKVDGLSVLLTYEKGKLVRACTRGDGVVGEDITANVIVAQGVPFITSNQFTGWVRGELVILTTDWAKLNVDGEFKTARNAAAGIARRSSGKAANYLTLIAHDLIAPISEQTMTHKLSTLEYLGFKTAQPLYVATLIGAQEFFKLIASSRDKLPYEIDGVVFTLNDLDKVHELGVDGEACWRGQVAWKFPAGTATTTLTGVKLTVGHTGAINPTAELAPVVIGGVTVTSASLANFDLIGKMDVSIGDTVEVSRRGDVIPKVERMVTPGSVRTLIERPTACPVCEGKVGYRKNVGGEDSAHIFCLNDDCPAKGIGKIKRWIKSLDIKEIGDEVLKAIGESKIMRYDPSQGPDGPAMFGPEQSLLGTVADLYRLHESIGFVSGIIKVNGKALGKKRAATILAEIDKTRTLTIDQFIGSLGVIHLGKRKVEIIRKADHTGFLDSVSCWFSRPDCMKMDGPCGPVSCLIEYANTLGIPNIAAEIQAGLDANRQLVDELLKYITITQPKEIVVTATSDLKLKDKSFCFTGVRAQPEELAKLASLGGVEKSGVSKGLTHLVAKDPYSTSSKAVKARKLGAQVISYQEFQELIK